MIDFQSSTSKQKTNMQSSEADNQNYSKVLYRGKKENISKTDIQSGSGKFKNTSSNVTHEKEIPSFLKTPKNE